VEELVERVQPVLVQREVGLQRLQVERDVADAGLERTDARGVAVDLVSESCSDAICESIWCFLPASSPSAGVATASSSTSASARRRMGRTFAVRES
jgi:hypothetical protein